MDIRRIQDINLDDINLRTRYYAYLMECSISEARLMVNAYPQLRGKVLDAETLNQFVNKVLDLEQNYYTDVEDVLNNELDIFNIRIDDLVYVGEYDNTETYERGNFVIYNSQLYFCIAPIDQTITDIAPTNTTYWLYLGLEGDKGTPPLGVKFKGLWNSSTTYGEKDMVAYDNKLYVAKIPSLGVVPPNSTYWLLALTNEPQTIYVQEDAPLGVQEGSIWFRITDVDTNRYRLYSNTFIGNVMNETGMERSDGA